MFEREPLSVDRIVQFDDYKEPDLRKKQLKIMLLSGASCFGYASQPFL